MLPGAVKQVTSLFGMGPRAGIGAGAGTKDVSKEIENEEQVLGTQNETEEAPPPEDMEEEDDGLEMAHDFEGELYDREPHGGEEGDSPSDGEDMEGKRTARSRCAHPTVVGALGGGTAGWEHGI
jgi:midasin